MNKIALTAGVALLMTGAVSCVGEGEEKRTVSQPASAYVLAMPVDGGEASVSKSDFRFDFDIVNSKVTMIAQDVVLDGNATTITAQDLPYYSALITLEGKQYGCYHMAGSTTTAPTVTSLNGDLTFASYTNVEELVGKKLKSVLEVNPLNRPAAGTAMPYLFASFKYNDKWNISTFWNDMLFCGNTTTRYPGMTEAYNTEGITYRAVLTFGKEGYKADLYFYNAKFAEKAPELNFVLKDLDLTVDRYGRFIIQGEKVAPVMIPEGSPNTRFTFDNVKMTTNMKTMTGDYSVAGIYTGQFSGTSAYVPQLNNGGAQQ